MGPTHTMIEPALSNQYEFMMLVLHDKMWSASGPLINAQLPDHDSEDGLRRHVDLRHKPIH